MRGESGGELGPSVCDNVIWEAVVFEYVLQVQAGGFLGVDLDGRGAEVYHLSESVHTDKDRIVASRLREFYDEVHGDRGPRSRRDR